MSLIETGLGQETRFYSPDMTAGGAGLSGAGQCRNVCIVKLSHFRGSLHDFAKLGGKWKERYSQKFRCRTVERMNACENILRLSLPPFRYDPSLQNHV